MSLTALLAAAALQAGPGVDIENFVGEIRIVEGASLSARVVRAGAGDAPDTTLDGEVLRIDGGVRIRNWRCRSRWGGEPQIGPRRGELRPIEDYPLLEITAPAGADLAVSDSIVYGRAGDVGAVDLSISSCGDFEIGSVAEDAVVAVSGSGDIGLGVVAGGVRLSISGSGDVEFVSAGSLDARVSGSGDIEGGDVSGPVELNISGSGDVDLGQVERLNLNASGSAEVEIDSAPGGVRAAISGSGELTFDRAGGFIAGISGSGDISGDRVDGAFEASVSGSGDIRIAAGRAEPFEASSGGSGEIRFGGTAVNPRVRINGGSVRLGAVEGEVDVNRSGADDLTIGR
jgi:hypothetical protein